MRARLGRPCVVATFRLNDPAMLLPGAHCSPRAAALRICRKVSRWSVWKGVSSMVERLLAGPPGRRRYEREHSRENTHVCCLSAEENQPVSRACLQPWSSSSPPPPAASPGVCAYGPRWSSAPSGRKPPPCMSPGIRCWSSFPGSHALRDAPAAPRSIPVG
jgi:hypothetical protein